MYLKILIFPILILLTACSPTRQVQPPTLSPTAHAFPTLIPWVTETSLPVLDRTPLPSATLENIIQPQPTGTPSPIPLTTQPPPHSFTQNYLPWVARPFLSYPDWTNVTWGPFNLVDPPGIVNPVLTARDVTDRRAEWVADPFLYREYWPWYMFFEVYDNNTDQGDIALASSRDGLHWEYDGVVLDEPFHLSYPYVFKVEDNYYMLPETFQLGEVRIYQATNFPYEWTYLYTIISGRAFVDPSIFFYDGLWWLFLGDADRAMLYLYHSSSLTEDWVEHPQSPLIWEDLRQARPGGRSFVFNGDQVIRIAQSWGEGIKIRAYQVDILTTEQYLEHEIDQSPLLESGLGSGDWDREGMHQFSPWWTGTYWLVAYDGRAADNDFSIGIKMAVHP